MNRGIKIRVYLFLKLPVSTISIHYFIDIKYKMEDDSSWQRLQDENSWLKARNEGLLA